MFRKFLFLSLALLPGAFLSASAQYDLIPQPRLLTVLREGRVTPRRTKTVLAETCPADSLREAYTLRIAPREIRIEAYTDAGVVWARRTLEQLRCEDGSYPQVEIRDWPEFPLRGFMYDTGRNFVEVEQLKEYIDLISRYKLNVFHWHLTDRPAWRIECRVHPELNDPAFQRIGRDEGRFYTYDQIREVIRFARERGVRVIPEIDMPGHSDFFDATFGCPMNSERGMHILGECLAEFFAEIPVEDAPCMHIGSDEIHIDNPREFMAWAVDAVRRGGRTPMVWDPGLDAGPEALYQVWRDGSDDAEPLKPGKTIVDSFMGYLNYVDPLLFTNRMFLHTPCYTGRASATEPGGILCLWNDVRVTDDTRLAPHNGMMGGVLPFAERFWRGGVVAERFRDVLAPADEVSMQRLAEFQRRMERHKERFLTDELAYWAPNRPSTCWDAEFLDREGNLLRRLELYGDVVDLDAVCRMHGLDSAVLCRATRRIDAPEARTAQVRIGFDAPARSNRLSDGIARQGEWENFGTVEVNGKAVRPPVWEQPGLYRFHFNTWNRPEEELAYTDEQLYWMRRPVDIRLRKGENRVTLSTRRHFQGQRFQFAFVGL